MFICLFGKKLNVNNLNFIFWIQLYIQTFLLLHFLISHFDVFLEYLLMRTHMMENFHKSHSKYLSYLGIFGF